MLEHFADLIKSLSLTITMGVCREIVQYRNSSGFEMMKTWKSLLLVVCFVGVSTLGSPTTREDESSAKPIYIIKPPVRCPEGMKLDASGRCRVVWEKRVDSLCSGGERGDDDEICREVRENSNCSGDECFKIKKEEKGDVAEKDYDNQVEAIKSFKRQRRMEALKRGKKITRRSNLEDERAGKHSRSKHAFLIMLKKKKMQMMKPKPPPSHHPPPHHPPHHHPPHNQESQEEPEEEPAEEEDEPAPEGLFFGDEICDEEKDSEGGCQPDAELVEKVEANKEFKEWKPEKSSESSDSSSSSSSSSSDSTGENESDSGGSGEPEDEVLEKAIKIKLMKLFRLKQRYGPAFRQWLANQLREYEGRKEKKEIISTRCLEAVKETMEVIKDNLEVEGLFTTSGNLRTRKKIQSYLSRGDIYTLRNWGFEFVIECAAALKIFLQNLPQPLIPIRIQQLVIAENSGVPEKTIANDALGLLKEEVNGRHKELLLEVFTFLKEAAIKVNTSELTGCNLPLKLLPVFFDIESNDPQKFRDIATVFHEIIMEAPEHLKTPCRKIPSAEMRIIERILSQDMRMASGSLMNSCNGRNQPTGENSEWRIPLPRVPHTRLHPWLGHVEHSTSA